MLLKNLKRPFKILSDTYGLESIVNDNELLMVIEDSFEEGSYEADLINAEQVITDLVKEKKTQKRMFHIMLECAQNIQRHGNRVKSNEDISSLLVIGKQQGCPYILTGNPIQSSKIEELKARFEQIESVDINGLRNLYKEVLSDGQVSALGGAGLGLVDMARKAGGKIEYGFQDIVGDVSYFSLKVNFKT